MRAGHSPRCLRYAWSPQLFQAYVSVPFSLFRKSIQLCFNATKGAGGLSISPQLSIGCVRENFPIIEDFFYELYNFIHFPPWYGKSVDELLDRVREELTLYYSSGAASPTDVDICGRTPINLNLEFATMLTGGFRLLDGGGKGVDSRSEKRCQRRGFNLFWA